jgi:hypothetical protein
MSAHEITLADRLRASVSNPRPPVRERVTCESEGRESFDEQELKNNSCHICGDPPDYCVACDECRKPVCDKCRLLGEIPICFRCAI